MATETVTRHAAADTLNSEISKLYNVKAVLAGIYAMGEALVENCEASDDIARLAGVGEDSLQRVIEALVPVRDALRGSEVSHGDATHTGAKAFQDLLRTLAEKGDSDIAARMDETESGADARDYAALAAMVRQSIEDNLDHTSPAHREGFLRALTYVLSADADSAKPLDYLDAIRETSAAFAEDALNKVHSCKPILEEQDVDRIESKMQSAEFGIGRRIGLMVASKGGDWFRELSNEATPQTDEWYGCARGSWCFGVRWLRSSRLGQAQK